MANVTEDRGTGIVGLRVGIESRWTSRQFARFFDAVSTLYGGLTTLNRTMNYEGQEIPIAFGAAFDPDRPPHRRAAAVRLAIHDAYPEVGAIRYSSPGSIDFLGAGRVLAELRELVKDILYRNRLEQREADLRNQLLEQEVRRSELRTRALSDLSKRIFDDPDQVPGAGELIVHLFGPPVGEIVQAVGERRIASVQLVAAGGANDAESRAE